MRDTTIGLYRNNVGNTGYKARILTRSLFSCINATTRAMDARVSVMKFCVCLLRAKEKPDTINARDYNKKSV